MPRGKSRPFSPVTAAKPAKGGEVLIVKATGLGPTRPGIDPGQPFPSDAIQEVNSPFGVTVNGKAAEVINKSGWPGLVVTGGTAAIQLTVGARPSSPGVSLMVAAVCA